MSLPQKIDIPRQVNVSEAARSAMVGAETYRDGAARLLEIARGDAELMSAIMEPYEMSAAMEAVQLAVKNFRRAAWVSPNRQAQSDRVVALVRSNREMLMDFPLPGGLALRFATKADVSAAAGFYSTHSADMAHKSRWLMKVARSTPAGKTVGDAMDNSRLEKLQEDTRNG